MNNAVKKYGLAAAELLIFLVLLFIGLSKRPEVIWQSPSGLAEQMHQQAEEGAAWISEDILLKPGVYRLTIETDREAEAPIYAQIRKGNEAIFRELLDNELVLESGQKYACGSMTVTASMEGVRLQLTGNSGNVQKMEMILERTGQLYSVLAVCYLIVAASMNLLIFLRKAVLEKRVNCRQQTVIWILAATVLLANFPGLTDYITVSGDTMQYLLRMEAYAQGQTEALGSHWYLVLPAIFRKVGFTVQTAWQLFIWCVTVLTAVFSYLALKYCTGNDHTSLAFTILILLNPVRISSFYEDGNVLEWLLMGLVFIPVGLAGLAIRRQKWSPRFVKILSYMLYVLAGLAVICALYLGNDLAFHLEPAYLYDLSDTGWMAYR